METGSRPTPSGSLPLTERVLRRLGDPALLWIVAWGLIGPIRPFVNAAALLALGDEAAASEMLERNALVQWVLGYLIVLTLIGTRVLTTRVDAARPSIRQLTGDDPGASGEPIRGMGSLLGPLALALVIDGATKLGQLGKYPAIVNALDFALMVMAIVPMATWLWTYGCVLLELDRLGRHALALRPFPPDRGLGLRPLGSLAFIGVAVIAAGVIPYLLLLAREPVDVVIGVTIFLVSVALFVLSLWRLHLQMTRAKAGYVREASNLYMEAFGPLRESYSLDTLMAQAPLLGAAESLEKRAESILEWPIDDRVVGRLVIVVTGVVTAVASTFVLQQIGFQ